MPGEMVVTGKDLQNVIGIDASIISRVLMAFFAIMHYLPDGSVAGVQGIFNVHKVSDSELFVDIRPESLDDSMRMFAYLEEHGGIKVEL